MGGPTCPKQAYRRSPPLIQYDTAMRRFDQVYFALREVMRPCEPVLEVVRDTRGEYYLNCKKPSAGDKPMFFGAVQIKKRYVSYHLMPVYVFPDLIEGLSPALRKRMHGNSCFNFARPDSELRDGRRKHTLVGLRRFREADMLQSRSVSRATRQTSRAIQARRRSARLLRPTSGPRTEPRPHRLQSPKSAMRQASPVRGRPRPLASGRRPRR